MTALPSDCQECGLQIELNLPAKRNKREHPDKRKKVLVPKYFIGDHLSTIAWIKIWPLKKENGYKCLLIRK